MVEIDSESQGRKLFMSWAQVRQLADSDGGLTIGSHAYSHRKLAGLDDDAQRHELAGSKQILETQLGRLDQGAGLSLWLAGHIYRGNQSTSVPGRISISPFLLGKALIGSPVSIHTKSDGWELARLTPLLCSELGAHSTPHSVDHFSR